MLQFPEAQIVNDTTEKTRNVLHQINLTMKGGIHFYRVIVPLTPLDALGPQQPHLGPGNWAGRVRDGFEAVEVATFAGKLTESIETTNIAAQTAAHAEVGAFDRADECQRRALSSTLAKQYEVEAEQRLANYLQGKPYRDSQLMPAHLP